MPRTPALDAATPPQCLTTCLPRLKWWPEGRGKDEEEEGDDPEPADVGALGETSPRVTRISSTARKSAGGSGPFPAMGVMTSNPREKIAFLARLCFPVSSYPTALSALVILQALPGCRKPFIAISSTWNDDAEFVTAVLRDDSWGQGKISERHPDHLEGVEGSGKTTQLRRLANPRPPGRLPIVETREPGGDLRCRTHP